MTMYYTNLDKCTKGYNSKTAPTLSAMEHMTDSPPCDFIAPKQEMEDATLTTIGNAFRASTFLSDMASELGEYQDVTYQQLPLPQSQQEDLCGQDSSTSPDNNSTRKRKYVTNSSEDYDDDIADDKSVKTNDDSKKQNHSEIEKRRRDKMNKYITELAGMVPVCHAIARKLDKLTVLRMAVQHLKSIRGAVHSYTKGRYKPAFLSDQELKALILQSVDGFLFVVGCDRARILYVSESVSQILHYTQGDLLGQSWFDILHPKDVAKVKEQLSSSAHGPRERFIDAKTMLPVKTDMPQGLSRLCPGARRSFFCRMKRKHIKQISDDSDSSGTTYIRRKKQNGIDRKYCVVQCTGYLKSWPPAKVGMDETDGDPEVEQGNLSCLVAVGRVHNPSQLSLMTPNPASQISRRKLYFISRHAMDGKFLFVDQRATLILGFLPQELLGTSMYEYYHPEDIPGLADSHKRSLVGMDIVKTPVYRFRSKDGSMINIQSEWKSFKNPWTKDVEYLISKNYISSSNPVLATSSPPMGSNQQISSFDFFNQANNCGEIQKFIHSRVESSKIGVQIAEEVIENQRRSRDSSISPDSSPEPFNTDPLSAISLSVASNISEEALTPQLMSDCHSVDNQHPLQNQQTLNMHTLEVPQHHLGHRPGNRNGLLPNFDQVRNVALASSDVSNTDDDMMEMVGRSGSSASTSTNDGNDEETMAVIMSLLEADAGLGGPVDFSGLPWPLP